MIVKMAPRKKKVTQVSEDDTFHFNLDVNSEEPTFMEQTHQSIENWLDSAPCRLGQWGGCRASDDVGACSLPVSDDPSHGVAPTFFSP